MIIESRGGEGPSQYEQLGVDAGKQDVRRIFKERVENEYPNAFVNIITDPLHKEYGLTQHMDGDGSKLVQRLLIYSETGNPKVIRGAVDDALEMNLGDIAASGFVSGTITVTDVVNVNALNIPKKVVMEEIGQRFEELIGLYRKYGSDIHFLGGETGDLPTQVTSAVFDVAVWARALKKDLIKGDVVPGDKIFGFASDGQAAWEDEYNSGIMSNGLTLGRVGTMSSEYEKKYPYLGIHHGKYRVGEKVGLANDMSVSDALISPTRHWGLFIKILTDRLKKEGVFEDLDGIVMNTGGGVSKISHIGRGILYMKKMPPATELVKFIQRETGESWKAMYKGFNCGVGLDVVVKDKPKIEQVLKAVAEETSIKSYELGICDNSQDGQNHVTAETDYGPFDY
jgi:phosphoribosylformylglycinamidine cyclo-ligase